MTSVALSRLCFRSLSVFAGLLFAATAQAADYELRSPDGELTVKVSAGESLSFGVAHGGKPVLEAADLGLVLADGSHIGRNLEVTQDQTRSVNRQVKPVVKHKSAIIDDHFRELSLTFGNGFGIDLRAYNDGVAYRLTGHKPGEVIVQNESLTLDFPQNARSLFPEEDSFISHFERHYIPTEIKDIDKGRFASLPTYMSVDDISVVFTEADLFDYPGMFLFGTGDSALTAGFPGYVTKTTPTPGSEDRNQLIESADFIAKTDGKRTFPWRVAVISDQDTDLVESQLVYLLSRENQLDDTDWIEPGRIAWDWYNASNVFDVDFKAGLNTETYKYYIDFASEYGLEYVILDEGWTKSTTNILESNPELDVQELIRYGKEKDVGIILWALWGPLDKDYKNILKTWGEWGAAGIKVDFMQRADQAMVNYYTKIAKEAAKHQLLVDYHGGYKPAGLRRAYPNVMTYEGVKGAENNKWSQDVTPEHNVTLPFIRMVAGPMDYTPGALRNANIQNHNVNFFRPMSIGTRAHQVAMYAVYESALQMLCESPSTYLREPEITEFIAKFPAVWDETLVLDAKVADYILVARRHGDTWYLGAMTDGEGRELELDFSFLKKGDYTIDYVRDGVNTQNYAEDYKREQTDVHRKDKWTIRLAPGGGWAAVVTPAE